MGTDRRAPARADRQRSRLLPLLGVLIIAILILQLSLVAIAVSVAHGFSVKSANVAVESTATVMAERLDTYFTTAVAGAGLTAYAVTERQAAVGTPGLDDILFRVLVLTPELSGVHVVGSDGSEVEVSRSGSGYIVRTITPAGMATTETRDASFALVGTQTAVGVDDPRATPEYVTIAASLEPQWLAPRVVDGVGASRVAYSLPVVTADGTLQAVVWVEVSLAAMAAELDASPQATGAVTLLVDAHQNVIAAPAEYESRVRDYETATGLAMPVAKLGFVAAAPLQPVSPAITDAADTSSLRLASGWVVVEQRVLADGVPDVRIYVQARSDLAVPGATALIPLFRAIAIALAISAVVTPVIAWAVRGRMATMASRAAHDHLTGIANRDEVIRLVPRMILDSREAGYATCVMMFDVDNFKSLNDAHGHDAGDRALIIIVEALFQAMRGSDVCGRWGGDEFILVMSLPPGQSPFEAVDRLRTRAETALVEEFPGLDLGITAGFAVSSEANRDFGTLTNLADDALVAGKRRKKSRSYSEV